MKNTQKGFEVPLLIVIIALLLVGGGIYIYQNKETKVPVTVDSVTSQTDEIQQIGTSSEHVVSSPIPTPSVSNPVISSNRPSIKVLYPDVGEVLNNGGRDNIATIKWSSSGLGDSKVQITAIDKANNVKTVALDAPNTGSFDWKMDPTIISGEYKINIATTKKGLNASDYSDGYFVIYTRNIVSGKPFVTLVSPNGGEVFTSGSKVVIKWSSLGEKPTSATITLSNNARCPYGYSCSPLPNSFTDIAVISGSQLERGEYEWVVSKSNVISFDNYYKINVMVNKDNLGNVSFDDSDSGFIIN